MNMARTVTALSLAIESYRAKDGKLSAGEKAMLARLRMSKAATEAFAAWELSDVKGFVFVRDCVAAHRLLNGGHKKKVAAVRASPDPDKARKDLAAVANFFSMAGYCMRLDSKALRDKTRLCLGPDPDVVSEAIVLLASLIGSTEDTNKSARPTVSRKGDKPSARASAIGLLKESVRRLSGSPNLKAVENIAGEVLDLHGSKIDLAVAVKNARTPSEWFSQWGK